MPDIVAINLAWRLWVDMHVSPKLVCLGSNTMRAMHCGLANLIKWLWAALKLFADEFSFWFTFFPCLTLGVEQCVASGIIHYTPSV